jgi:hypothetical protein
MFSPLVFTNFDVYISHFALIYFLLSLCDIHFALFLYDIRDILVILASEHRKLSFIIETDQMI